MMVLQINFDGNGGSLDLTSLQIWQQDGCVGGGCGGERVGQGVKGWRWWRFVMDRESGRGRKMGLGFLSDAQFKRNTL